MFSWEHVWVEQMNSMRQICLKAMNLWIIGLGQIEIMLAVIRKSSDDDCENTYCPIVLCYTTNLTTKCSGCKEV